MIRRSEGAITVGDGFKLFITSKVKVNPVTVSNYELSFELFLRDNNIDEKFPLKKVTSQYIDSWVKNSPRTESAKNHHLISMRVFLYWCMREGYIPKYHIELIKRQQPPVRYYTDEELAILVKKPKKSELFSQYRTYVAICFVLATGARASTLINIKISDINFSNNEITYRHLKNRQTAIIPLSPTLAHILQEYLRLWSREKEDGWLFCEANEDKCTVSALHQALENYCRRRGVVSKGMHCLRHSYSRQYIMNGGNAFALQRLLGHSTMEMTKRYVRLFGEDLKVNYDKLCPLDNYKLDRKATVKRV